MDIHYAILGLLSVRPLSGYDLKKIIARSDLFYWSGNNNQIYTSLVQLHKGGLVTQEVQPQESLPARKIYSITEAGREALHALSLSAPGLPEVRKPFLVQLAWADGLTDEELDGLLAAYEDELAVQVRMRAQQPALPEAPGRTPRERFLWESIAANLLSSYQHELDWVRRVRKELKGD